MSNSEGLDLSPHIFSSTEETKRSCTLAYFGRIKAMPERPTDEDSPLLKNKIPEFRIVNLVKFCLNDPTTGKTKIWLFLKIEKPVCGTEFGEIH